MRGCQELSADLFLNLRSELCEWIHHQDTPLLRVVFVMVALIRQLHHHYKY